MKSSSHISHDALDVYIVKLTLALLFSLVDGGKIVNKMCYYGTIIWNDIRFWSYFQCWRYTSTCICWERQRNKYNKSVLILVPRITAYDAVRLLLRSGAGGKLSIDICRRQTSCASLLLSTDGTDRRTDGHRRLPLQAGSVMQQQHANH